MRSSGQLERRHLKVLKRRLGYLDDLEDPTTWDRVERSALLWAITSLEVPSDGQQDESKG